MAEFSTAVSPVVRKQSLHANIIRACANCGAPGYWHNTPGVNVGCYAPEKVTQLGANPVGAICPECGAAREPVEPRGQIWSREWRVRLVDVLWQLVIDLCKPLRWRAK